MNIGIGTRIVREVRKHVMSWDPQGNPCGKGYVTIIGPFAAEQVEALVEDIVRERLADVEAARKILNGDDK